MSNWSSTWQFKFNEAKCKHLNQGPPTKNLYEIQTNNNLTTITTTGKEKDPGVIIDKDLNGKEHIYTQNFKGKQNSWNHSQNFQKYK